MTNDELLDLLLHEFKDEGIRVKVTIIPDKNIPFEDFLGFAMAKYYRLAMLAYKKQLHISHPTFQFHGLKLSTEQFIGAIIRANSYYNDRPSIP